MKKTGNYVILCLGCLLERPCNGKQFLGKPGTCYQEIEYQYSKQYTRISSASTREIMGFLFGVQYGLILSIMFYLGRCELNPSIQWTHSNPL